MTSADIMAAFGENGPLPRAAIEAAGQRRAEMVPLLRLEPKVGRNDPCPCGSGKKFKRCCLT